MIDEMTWRVRALIVSLSVAAVGYPDLASARRSDRFPTCLPVTDHTGDDKVDVSLLRGHRLTSTRVAFRLASATLVVDYAAFDAEIAAFLRKNGEQRFPYERQIRESLHAAVAGGGEVKAEEWLPDDREHRLDYLLAAMLEQGAFELRGRETAGFAVYRIANDSSLRRSRRFALPNCQVLVEILDRIR
jgi:hypothetical protein